MSYSRAHFIECQLLMAAALPVELRVFIDYFAAKRVEDAGPWPVYASPDGQAVLLEIGVGSLAASAAVAYAFGVLRLPSTCTVLNLGIAGSGAYARGQWVLAQEVIDVASGTHFYLRPPRIAGIERGAVRSYAKPSDDYGLPALLDMEAAGLVAAAKRFVALEQIWVAKLVSDNSVAQQRSLDKPSVRQLLLDNLEYLMPAITEALHYSEKELLATQLPSVPSEWLEQLHFSVSHKRHLANLWRSYRVFFPNHTRLDLSRFRSAKEVIGFLEAQLQTVSLHWEDM